MSTSTLQASVPQTPAGGKCPKCGSPLVVRWSWAGGRGERLVARCSCENAPSDGNGGRWCDFGCELEGNEHLFATA